MRKTRKARFRNPKKLIILICEGSKSEIAYFQGIFNSNPQNKEKYVLKAYQPNNFSPLGIVNQCLLEINDANSNKIQQSDITIFAIFDKDQHENLELAFQKAESSEIKVIFSSICFEFWILLHYKKTTKPFHNCDELIKYVKSNYNSKFEKNEDNFDYLNDKINDAIKNGKWLIKQIAASYNNYKTQDLNPYTNAHELAAFLQNL